jgi:hypothetical protein
VKNAENFQQCDFLELVTVIGSDLFSLVNYITPDLQLQFSALKEHMGIDSFALSQ